MILEDFEKRPGKEVPGRRDRINHLVAINRFEGIVPTDKDWRIFNLWIMGRVTKEEYLQLSLQKE